MSIFSRKLFALIFKPFKIMVSSTYVVTNEYTTFSKRTIKKPMILNI